jgi:hypothetical protein
MPSAPRPTRASSKTSAFSLAEARSTSPVPVTSSRPASCAARPAAVPPVPCVPVEVAPASVCSAMSPMLCSDRPSRSSARLRSLSGVPARAVAVIAVRSTSSTPVSPSGRSSVCSGAAIAVKLCPVPVILTPVPSSRARRTASTTAATDAGVATRAGVASSRPDQLRQRVPVGIVWTGDVMRAR